MRIWLNKHFGFNKSEFNGLLILLLMIMLLKALPPLYNHFRPLEVDSQDLQAQIAKIEITDQNSFQSTRDRIESSINKKTGVLFNFDPNHLDTKGWERLGLSAKQAKSIVNYTVKGGQFYKAEDLQKMYTISPEMYKKLLPYIQIEGKINKYPNTQFKYEKKEYIKKAPVMVDINAADSAQFDEVKGIGGTFANRILKYRDRLGGFYKKEQLLEVYGLDSVKYDEIKSQVFIGNVNLKIININTAVFNDLKSSPYLSYKQINAIVQYRKQHGNYSTPADLKKIMILNQEVIDKITPYISF